MMEGYSICQNAWLFDKDIKNELPLLIYISSLSNKEGFCYATNGHFAEKFQEDTATISRKIKKLEAKKYIEVVYKKRGFEIVARELRLTKMSFDHLQKCQWSIDKNVNGSNDENVKENNISINNINIKKERKKEAKTYADVLSVFSLSERLTKTIMDFIQMRKFIKKPMTNRGLELMIGKLQKMSTDEETQIKILEQSIMNNWQGVFELKEEVHQEANDERWKRFMERNSD